MSSIEITTNFKDSNNVDLGKKLVTKDYLISVYPSIASKIGYTPDLWMWGRGGNGQLGNNSYTSVSTPITTFSGGTSWKQISCGTNQVAAIKIDGTLWVWGNNSTGILGNASVTTSVTPVTTFIGGTDWKYVNAGESITAAIKTDGTLWVWGNASYGVCGNDISPTIISTPITTFAGGTNWKQVSCGKFHTAATKTDGTLWIWGSQSTTNGVLGTNGYQSLVSTPITTFAGGTTWADTSTTNAEDLYTLSISIDYAMAIKTDGTIWGWGNGRNIGANLTNNNNAQTPTTTFAGGTTWKELSCGKEHTAAIKTDGTLWLWGSTNNRLGDGSTFASLRYTPVTTFLGGTTWKQISSGSVHNLAIKTDGTLWTWGGQANNQLGIRFGTPRSTPVTTFAGGTTWSHVSAGYIHSAAIKTDGTLWMWGEGNGGRLAHAKSVIATDMSTPITTFIGGTTWKQVSCGFEHTSAIKTDGTLWLWGGNSYGQLGNAAVTSFVSTPITTFLGGTNWKQVASAKEFTAAVKTDGTLWVWGKNTYGQLANGNADFSRVSTPVTTFLGGTSWKQVGSNHSSQSFIALRDTGSAKELFLSGDNRKFQLGTLLNYSFVVTPITTFAGGTNWKQVSCGNDHTAATKTDGTLWLWGGNASGQLATGSSFSSRNTPVTTFSGGTKWNLVSTANNHSAAIKTDGTLWLWGGNSYGQLGIGHVTTRSTPVTTFLGGTLWKTVELGNQRSYSIKTDGTLWSWGFEYSGSLGNAQDGWTNRSTPSTTFLGGTYWKQVSASKFSTGAVSAALRSSDFYD
jgi:alpha-tubulin suppressor-like RCC1 family protein